MRIKKGFELQTICGVNMVVATGVENINFTKVVSLNESAAEIWKAVVGKDFTLDDMVKALTEVYEVAETAARADCQQVIDEWTEIGFLAV